MKVLFINEVCGHTSTGKICAEQAMKLHEEGNEVKIAYGRDDFVPENYREFAIRIGSNIDVKIHGIATRLFDAQGLGSTRATKEFLKWAENFGPDLLWLHNIHGYYINYLLLFRWIKSRPQMKVKWTLHDCWSFTGHCTFFTYAKCEKWRTHCENCPQKKTYPASLFLDRSRQNYDRKREAFTGVKDVTVITPSKWLAELVKESFLSGYPVEIVYNTVDTSVFKPTPSNFRARNGLEGKKIILAVSNAWQEPRKGLKDIIQLWSMLDPEYYGIVIVGLTDEFIKTLPDGIIGIAKTNSAKELAEIYTAADVLFNPTYEDNYPTVNLEAEACGTRVITYQSGGAPETIRGIYSLAVKPGDLETVRKLLVEVKNESIVLN